MTGPLAPAPGKFVTLFAPHKFTSGGPEATHQVAALMRRLGIDARILYVTDRIAPGGCPDAYRHYEVPEVAELDDSLGSVLVVPQTWGTVVPTIQRAKVAVWWLGINNPGTEVRHYFGGKTPTREGIFHLHQSEFARRYLFENGVEHEIKSLRLGDFLNDRQLAPRPQVPRKNVVAFNPSKDYAATHRLMGVAMQRGLFVPWFPLYKLDSDTVASVLSEAKVYVDMGPHPGLERIPREAAIAGACVITGLRGSAGFEADVPLPQGFKVENLDGVVDKLFACLLDWETESPKLDGYRGWVRSQPARVEAEIMELFGT